MQKITLTAPATIEVLTPTAPPDGIRLVEHDDGVQLTVPRKTRDLLVSFGWAPPVDEDVEQ